ncbi:MAG: phenylacetate--CoA ligase family protein [Candidatus Saccharimonadales bacterium]
MNTNLLLPRGYRNADQLHQKLHQANETVITRSGGERTLALFHGMAKRVPAYKEFLREHNLDPSKIRTIADLKLVPPIDKDNYLRKYSREMLCWDGTFGQGSWVISTTSGSTGKPYYFPREASQDWQYAATAELYLRNNFSIQTRRTLYIVAFPMGAWIGGLFTYEAIKKVAEHGAYDLSIITPGIHKQEVINAIAQLGDSFDQVIIGAYAPFLKDILDDGTRQGINWPSYNLGFVFSAEAFTETFRDYVLDVIKPKDKLRATLNHYGTVDLGTMAHETPESILIRRQLIQDDALAAIFPEASRQPTLCQYDPKLFYFEEVSGNLLCSAFSGIPLVRYNLKDYGGTIKRSVLHQKLNANNIDIDELIKTNGISDTTWNLPFVYVYERNDFSVSYYAFLIYPDMIRRAIQQPQFDASITGKFTMLVDYNESGRQQLNIHIEKKHSIDSSHELTTQLQEAIHQTLLHDSSEYRETAGVVGEVVRPLIHLWNYEDQAYFKSGTKQKWVIK